MDKDEAQRALAGRRLTRRDLLRAAWRGGVGAAGLALVGCGDDDSDQALAQAAGFTAPESGEAALPANAPIAAAPEAFGGRVRLHASLVDLDYFDSHRAAYTGTHLFASLQQSKLLRQLDVNAGTLEPDLLDTMPEIPDESTYVCTLRPGVTWWDTSPTHGRALTANDIRLNVERQIVGADAAGDPDPLLQRAESFRLTGGVEVLDDETVLFRTVAPLGTYLRSVLAGAWSFIQAPEIWQVFGDRLRDHPLSASYFSGTGAFRADRFQPLESISFSRSATYFRAPWPGLGGLEFRHLTDPADQRAAYANNELDVWSPGDPRLVDQAAPDFRGHAIAQRPLPFAIRLALSRREGSVMQDPRLASALHLALDRPGLLRLAYGPHAHLSGPVPWFAAGWSRPLDRLQGTGGYLERLSPGDISAIRELIRAAEFTGMLRVGMPDSFQATYPGVAGFVQESLTVRLGVEVEVVTGRYVNLLQELREGALPALVDWSPLALDADPTEAMIRSLHSAGTENVGGLSNDEVDAGLEAMRASFDEAERQRIYTQTVEPLLLNAPSWSLPAGHGQARSLVRPGLHMPAFGFGWDGHLWERAWVQDAL